MQLHSNPTIRRHLGLRSRLRASLLRQPKLIVTGMGDYYQDGYKWCQCDDCGRPNPHRCFTYTHCCWDCLISDGTSHSMECDSARIRRKLSRPSKRELMLLEIRRPGEIQLRICKKNLLEILFGTWVRTWQRSRSYAEFPAEGFVWEAVD